MRRLIAAFTAALLMLTLVGVTAAAAQDSDTIARGTIRDRSGDEPVPIEGVTITVTSADGSFTGEGTSDADGRWEVILPGGGSYNATINPDGLPEGVTLNDPDNTDRTFSVNEGRSQNVIFALSKGGGAGSFVDFGQIAQLLVDGIKLGLIIGMCAIGLSLIFGTTGLVNFAHGEAVTIGAVTAYLFNGWLDWKISLFFAAAIAFVVAGIFGGVFDHFVWAPLRRRGSSLISMLVVSIGFSILLRYLILFRLGGRAEFYADYRIQRRMQIGPVSLSPKDMFIMAFSLIVLVIVGILLQKTRTGKAMRAVADNRDLAESSGIDVQKVIRTVWISGSALAGLGGVLFGLTESIGWEMGFRLLLLMFAGTTLGGLGTAYGALVGCLIVGIFIQMSTLFIPPDTKNIGALLTLVVILLVRPQGILGKKERIG